MNRNWNDFKSLHSNISGAREAFENACETLFRKIYSGIPVSQVSVKQGDDGIDIFIGDLGVEPITVIQCKFFLESFGESQKSQIRSSFSSAIKSTNYELKEWILCIPRVIDIDEHSWWFKWKNKQISNYGKSKNFISIKNGNELIDLFKEKDLYNEVFKIEDSLKIQKIFDAVVPKQKNLSSANPQLILFNNYSKAAEEFYLERPLDLEFKNSLKINNVWVYGNSGFGKTALVNRNLITEQVDYCYCDLSPIVICCANDVLEEILVQIEDKFLIERNFKESNYIKNITQALIKGGDKPIVVVIDELSVDNDAVLKNIASNIINLVTYFSNSTDNRNLKFVISTISNPKQVIENKSKASEHFQYIDCNRWNDNIDELFDLINKSLNLNIDSQKREIIIASNNSPRILKSIFRKIFSLEHLTNESISLAIKICLSET